MARDNKLDRLSNLECIREYAEPIQIKRKNVLLVTADDKMPTPKSTENGTTLDIYAFNRFEADDASDADMASNSYSWICSANSNLYSGYSYCANNVDDIMSSSNNWTVGYMEGYSNPDDLPKYPIDYCLSEKAEPHCKIQFTLSIAILVTVLNFLKAVLIFCTAFGIKEDPLMTMGDAVASFLERQDETTKGMCLLSVHDVKKHKGYFPAGIQAWEGQQRRFKDVTSRTRRIVTFTM